MKIMDVPTRLAGVLRAREIMVAIWRRLSVLLWLLRYRLAGLCEPRSARTPLLLAVRSGDSTALERLLRDGADPNTRARGGWTALHEAVVRRRAPIAAQLLRYGADPRLADRRGRTPLRLDFTSAKTLHAIRQHYHRLPSPRRERPDREVSERARAVAAELAERGITRVRGLIGAEELGAMQRDFATFMSGLDRRVAKGEATFRHYDEEEQYWPLDRAYVSNNAFKHSEALVRLCCEPLLLDSAETYLGKPPLIQRGVAMRYLPSVRTRNDMFGWHHDMEEKRFKLMILLTEVGTSDQYMSYVVGSHELFHPYRMFFRNRCSLRYCRRHLANLEIFDATGQAGDVFIFDSNGAHRGVRSESGATRDVFIVEYSSDRSADWGGDIDAGFLEALTPARPNPFGPLLSAEKKWQLPVTRSDSVPTWVESLPHFEAWL